MRIVSAQDQGISILAPEGTEPEVGDTEQNSSIKEEPIYSIQYKVETGGEVHQWIAYQARFIWTTLEIDSYNYLKNNYDDSLDSECYQTGEGILIGSGEEDSCGGITITSQHFWNPDNPDNGNYNDGLSLFDSSYTRAQKFYNEAKEYYRNGDKNRAYYYLGRVAHLLEDATVPAHVHLDQHLTNDDEYEEFTAGNHYDNAWGDGKNFKHFKGSDYLLQQYNYEALPWWNDNVKKNVSGLFKLFWYSAQKTQHFASDDVNGNNLLKFENEDFYRCFGPDCANYDYLWEDEGLEVVSQKNNIESSLGTGNKTSLKKVAEANIPHAMKAVAGLYRLFWIETHNLSTCNSGTCCDTSLSITKEAGTQPNGFTDFTYCDFGTNKIYKRDYYCSGTTAFPYNTNSLIQICQSNQICKKMNDLEAQCLTNLITAVQILFPTNNSFITSSNIDVVFNVTNWTVGGKGQTHIHFHIDNIQGLNFSDHLMFYNSPNNIVELNTNTGSTPFATWSSTNTLRLNNVSNGLHKLKVHLATSSHTLPGNPEADKTIEFFVSSSENIYGLVGNNSSGIDNDAILGDKNAPVTIIEFGDYQDPFSRKFWTETFYKLKRNYIDTGKVKLVFRDLPLNSIHPSAQIASEAAECIREKGGDAAYYEYHNKLFEEQNKLDSGNKSGPVTKTVYFNIFDLKKWAKDLGYDIENCLNNGTFAREVIQDLTDGDAMGIFGVPTFFINGRKIEGAYPYAKFEKVIEEEWNKTINNKMKIFSPQSKAYNKTSIPFNLTTINKSDNISYIDWNEARPRWSVLCKDCDEYGNTRKLIKILREGQHNLTFRAIKGANVSEKNISFFIDSIDPQIISTKPANRDFTNGSDFYVTYTENNLQETTLHYGEDKTMKNNCPSGRSKTCNLNINLTKYNGEDIIYSFELRDIANNTDKSRNMTVKVDTIPPTITKFNYTINKNHVTFNMSINESNFDKVLYKDFKETRPSWRNLCSSLRNDICYKKLFFKTGQHNVTIQISDKADNSIQINKEFAV